MWNTVDSLKAESIALIAADAVHLATAVSAVSDRFITNHPSDVPTAIAEIDVTYPDLLPEP